VGCPPSRRIPGVRRGGPPPEPKPAHSPSSGRQEWASPSSAAGRCTSPSTGTRRSPRRNRGRRRSARGRRRS
jgi:hypothetical protein